MGEIVRIRDDVPISPEVLLAQLLERATKGEIKSIMVSVHYAEGDVYHPCWTNQCRSSLAMHYIIAQAAINKEIDRG